MTDIIYAAQYSDDIYESAYETLSLHKTRAGAEAAIEKDRAIRFGRADPSAPSDQELIDFGIDPETYWTQYAWQQYSIEELEIER